jgi:hypothetical protein
MDRRILERRIVEECHLECVFVARRPVERIIVEGFLLVRRVMENG